MSYIALVLVLVSPVSKCLSLLQSSDVKLHAPWTSNWDQVEYGVRLTQLLQRTGKI